MTEELDYAGEFTEKQNRREQFISDASYLAESSTRWFVADWLQSDAAFRVFVGKNLSHLDVSLTELINCLSWAEFMMSNCRFCKL